MRMLAAIVSFAKVLVLALALLLLCVPIPTTWAAGGLSVTTPNGGQKWTIGKKYAIKWRKGTGGASVRISLTKSGRHYQWISKKTRNDGRYTWKIPTSVAAGSAYKVKIKSVKKKKVVDSSNAYFSINSGDVRAISKAKDTITKKLPTCLKSIKLGRTVRSRFTVSCPSVKRSGRRAKYYSFSLASAKKVTINLKSSIDTYLNLLQGRGRTGRIIESNDDGGSGRNSKIVKTLSKGSYTIEATTYAKRRSGAFTLSATSSGAVNVKVTTPNGGEKWTVGTKYSLRWNRGDAGTFVRIQLTKGDKHYQWISKKTRNDGRYTWKIPTSVAAGSQFKVKIKSVKNKGIFDSSNRYFTIKKKKTGGGGGSGGDYTYLYNHNAFRLSGHTIRWKSKTIQVSGATGSWRNAVDRWPTVNFSHVGFSPSSGNGIEIIGYAAMAACGLATHANWDDGRMAYCQVRIASDHGSKNCGTQSDTMTHEIGHCIGVFKHTADGGLMDATTAGSGNITSPVRSMISLLYSLRFGTDINSKLAGSSLSVQGSKDNKYDPAGRRLYTYTTYFMENGKVKTVPNW